MFSNATKRIRKAGCIVIILLLMCITTAASSRYADDFGFRIVEFKIYVLCLQEHGTQCDNIIKSKNILSSDFYAYNIPIPTTRRRVRYRRVWRPCRHNHKMYYIYLFIYYNTAYWPAHGYSIIIWPSNDCGLYNNMAREYRTMIIIRCFQWIKYSEIKTANDQNAVTKIKKETPWHVWHCHVTAAASVLYVSAYNNNVVHYYYNRLRIIYIYIYI